MGGGLNSQVVVKAQLWLRIRGGTGDSLQRGFGSAVQWWGEQDGKTGTFRPCGCAAPGSFTLK